jgi:hypothetical protein
MAKPPMTDNDWFDKHEEDTNDVVWALVCVAIAGAGLAAFIWLLTQ